MTDLHHYLMAAGRRPLLAAEEERRLARLIRAGHQATEKGCRANGRLTASDREAIAAGIEARAVLVESNLRLVVSIARRFPTHTLVDLSDLIQAGNQGLLLAAEQFDPDRGFRFSTYATVRVKQQIGRAFDKDTPALRMPYDIVNALRRDLRAIGELGQTATGHVATLERAYAAVSVDAPLGELSGTLADLQPSRTEGVDDEVTEVMHRAWVRSLLVGLPELHRSVLAGRFGFWDGEPKSIRAIASALGVSARLSRRLIAEGLQMVAERARPLPDG